MLSASPCDSDGVLLDMIDKVLGKVQPWLMHKNGTKQKNENVLLVNNNNKNDTPINGIEN
jgi:hypothetical protein